MNKLQFAKKLHEKFFALLEKHKDFHNFPISYLKKQSDNFLFEMTLKHLYGFKINSNVITNFKWQDMGKYMTICFIDKTTYTEHFLTKLDDFEFGKHWLRIYLKNPYTFIPDDFEDNAFYGVPVNTYNKFINELLEYQPKYFDPNNNAMYFEIEKAGKVFNDYFALYEKYELEAQQELMLKKKEYLLEEVQKLQKEIDQIKNDKK